MFHTSFAHFTDKKCQITKGWVGGLGFRARRAMRAGFSGPLEVIRVWIWVCLELGVAGWVWPGGVGWYGSFNN